jgi:hypothetical protein
MALTGFARVDSYFRRRSLRAIVLISVLVLGWIVFIMTFIEREPTHGVTSLASLRERALVALRHRDAEDLDVLFEPDSVTESYASDYVARLDAVAPRRIDVRLTRPAGDQLLVVVAIDGSGTAACTGWGVTADDGRWYLVGGATLLAADQCGPVG